MTQSACTDCTDSILRASMTTTRRKLHKNISVLMDQSTDIRFLGIRNRDSHYRFEDNVGRRVPRWPRLHEPLKQ